MNDTMPNKIKEKKWYDKLLFKKTSDNEGEKFDFKLSSLKWVGIVFAVSGVFLPFLINIILININNVSFEISNYISFFVNVISGLVGMIYVIKKISWQKFLESGAWGFYLFYFSFNFLIMFRIITVVICNNFGLILSNWIFLVCQSIINIIVIILIFSFAPSLRLRFKKTVKNDYILIMIIVIIAFFVLGISLDWLFKCLKNKIWTVKIMSQNQIHIYNLLLRGRLIDKILIFIFAIIIAPFVEELACRHGVFALSGNKWLGFFTSVFYFAGMHVQFLGDWNNILEYLGISITFTLAFLYVRGNVTYTIFLHMFNNIFAILIFFFQFKS